MSESHDVSMSGLILLQHICVRQFHDGDDYARLILSL